MDEDEVLDWGDTQNADDGEDAVSLGAEDDEKEFFPTDTNGGDNDQPGASLEEEAVAASEPATLSHKSSPEPTSRTASPSNTRSPRARPAGSAPAPTPKMVHALPPKPVSASVGFTSQPAQGVEATAMSRNSPQKRSQGGSGMRPRHRSRSPHRSTTPDLPPDWEVRQSRSQGGEPYYYNTRTRDHSWDPPLPDGSLPRRRHGFNQDNDSRDSDYPQNAQSRNGRKPARVGDSWVPENEVDPPRRGYGNDTWTAADEEEHHLRRRSDRPDYSSASHSQSQSYRPSARRDTRDRGYPDDSSMPDEAPRGRSARYVPPQDDVSTPGGPPPPPRPQPVPNRHSMAVVPDQHEYSRYGDEPRQRYPEPHMRGQQPPYREDVPGPYRDYPPGPRDDRRPRQFDDDMNPPHPAAPPMTHAAVEQLPGKRRPLPPQDAQFRSRPPPPPGRQPVPQQPASQVGRPPMDRNMRDDGYRGIDEPPSGRGGMYADRVEELVPTGPRAMGTRGSRVPTGPSTRPSGMNNGPPGNIRRDLPPHLDRDPRGYEGGYDRGFGGRPGPEPDFDRRSERSFDDRNDRDYDIRSDRDIASRGQRGFDRQDDRGYNGHGPRNGPPTRQNDRSDNVYRPDTRDQGYNNRNENYPGPPLPPRDMTYRGRDVRDYPAIEPPADGGYWASNGNAGSFHQRDRQFPHGVQDQTERGGYPRRVSPQQQRSPVVPRDREPAYVDRSPPVHRERPPLRRNVSSPPPTRSNYDSQTLHRQGPARRAESPPSPSRSPTPPQRGSRKSRFDQPAKEDVQQPYGAPTGQWDARPSPRIPEQLSLNGGQEQNNLLMHVQSLRPPPGGPVPPPQVSPQVPFGMPVPPPGLPMKPPLPSPGGMLFSPGVPPQYMMAPGGPPNGYQAPPPMPPPNMPMMPPQPQHGALVNRMSDISPPLDGGRPPNTGRPSSGSAPSLLDRLDVSAGDKRPMVDEENGRGGFKRRRSGHDGRGRGQSMRGRGGGRGRGGMNGGGYPG